MDMNTFALLLEEAVVRLMPSRFRSTIEYPGHVNATAITCSSVASGWRSPRRNQEPIKSVKKTSDETCCRILYCVRLQLVYPFAAERLRSRRCIHTSQNYRAPYRVWASLVQHQRSSDVDVGAAMELSAGGIHDFLAGI